MIDDIASDDQEAIGFFCADDDCAAEPYDGPVQIIRLPRYPVGDACW